MPRVTGFDDRLADYGDSMYESLMRLHEGLSEEESHALNARLVLLMANEIGDLEKLNALFQASTKE